MKRICVIINHMEQGGVTSSLRNFCIQVSRLGYDVDFLDMSGNTKGNSWGTRSLNLTGIRRYWNLTFHTFRTLPLCLKVLLFPLAVLKVLTNKSGLWHKLIFFKYSIKQVYDCVFAYNQCAPCYYFALNCIIAKKKVALIHGDIDYMGDISSWSAMLSSFDTVACVSKAVTHGFANRFPNIAHRFCTLYNMFDIENIKQKAEDLPSITYNNSKVNIVSVSRHDNVQKGVNRIPEICEELLKRSIDNFQWFIVGGGPDYKKNIETSENLGLGKYLVFCGPQENPYPFIAQSDFLVLPSYTEAYGMVVTEAQILGVPSVVAEYPAVFEIVKDNVNALIAEQSVDSLTDKISDMILDKNGIRTSLCRNLKSEPFVNTIAIGQFYRIVETNS